MASTSAFQAEDEGSIPSTCSRPLMRWSNVRRDRPPAICGKQVGYAVLAIDYMVPWSNGYDVGLSRRKQEFNSPRNRHCSAPTEP